MFRKHFFWVFVALLILSACTSDGSVNDSGNNQSLCTKERFPDLGEICEAYYGCYGVYVCTEDGSDIYCKPDEDCPPKPDGDETNECTKERFPELGEVCEAYYGCYGVFVCNEDNTALVCMPSPECEQQESSDGDYESEAELVDISDLSELEDSTEQESDWYETEETDFTDSWEEYDWGEISYEPPYTGLEDLFDDDLKEALYEIIKNHHALGYNYARVVMFSDIDNVNGRVQCVYTGRWVETDGIPPSNVMNTEHTWCQSWGADSEPARSDLHHLFPTMSYANSRRSNHPFGWVVDVYWEEGGSKLGEDTRGVVVFEPRNQHKGDAARAIFYFSVRYQMSVEDHMEAVLKEWNHLDPVDAWERQRNDKIEEYQNNRNPFVDHPEFVDRISDF